LRSRKRIVVLHLAGQYPLGGIGWQAIHHVVGLARLGHDVYFVDDSGAWAYDPRVKSLVKDCAYSVEFLRRTMERFGLGDRWAYVDGVRHDCYGLSATRLAELYREADALVNVCGASPLREEHMRCPVRVYLQTDPVHDQIQLFEGNAWTRTILKAHTHHFTYGENLGQPDCPVPLEDLQWRPTRPPVVLDLWTPRVDPGAQCFTTVATWKNVGKDVHFGGETYYWSKHLNFLRFVDLPRLTRQPFELAVETDDRATVALFAERGWRLTDAYLKSRDVDVYQEYIDRSRGEFTAAKDLVVRMRSGWFSDRSVCYLAAGKPVVTQDTAFGKFVPTGRGLFAVNTPEEAAAAVDEINRDYADHARGARAIAAEFFDSDRVLADLCLAADL
jgi:glycosyltransferase involved in cell wall biosynthesis